MATRSVSPGGALLRASRLFSMPVPLPRPAAELTSSVTFNSETATLPYPTHLTITTPPSSLSKGDWGLKRPLPLRSTTKTSTPLIRVETIDTLEHITEYGSAADHTLTLQKWQEMNMPISTPTPKDIFSSSPKPTARSVFDEDLHTTSDGKSKIVRNETRWRFQGPWLAGLSVVEFNDYIKKTIRARKAEFKQFLIERKAIEDTKAIYRKVTEIGNDLPPAIKASDVTDEQLQIYMRQLRQDRMTLLSLIRIFLDLPPSPASESKLDIFAGSMFMGTGSLSKTPTIHSSDYQENSISPYAETGPPKTHPSAGLSYLRTKRHLYNHPIYGPQERPPPVQGRIIMPKTTTLGRFAPKLGIAGVVTDVPAGDSFNTSNIQKSRYGQLRKESYPGLMNIEPDRMGGSKLYLHPNVASIDPPTGRISLEVASGDGPARAILEGKVEHVPEHNWQPMESVKTHPRLFNRSSQGYGLESSRSHGDLAEAAASSPGNRESMRSKSPGSRADLTGTMGAFQSLMEESKK